MNLVTCAPGTGRRPSPGSAHVKLRKAQANSPVLMLRSLTNRGRVYCGFRNTEWATLFTADPGLSVAQIILSYGANWKIESGFRKIKQEIGSARTQTRTTMRSPIVVAKSPYLPVIINQNGWSGIFRGHSAQTTRTQATLYVGTFRLSYGPIWGGAEKRLRHRE